VHGSRPQARPRLVHGRLGQRTEQPMRHPEEAVDTGGVRAGFLLPDEMTLRPPRHLEALEASCRRRGVTITAAEVRGVERCKRTVTGIVTDSGVVRGGGYCYAAGAWSGGVAAALGLTLETRPIRGQILLLRLPRRALGRVVNFGIDYLVSRDDGRLLVGSTIEDAGFAATTTPEAVDRLLGVAHRLLGPLPEATVDQAWAGLRPGSVDPGLRQRVRRDGPLPRGAPPVDRHRRAAGRPAHGHQPRLRPRAVRSRQAAAAAGTTARRCRRSLSRQGRGFGFLTIRPPADRDGDAPSRRRRP
ncbi:MAG: FAD-dependent oxidoreductase, partial [Planctomycetia bacterium]|nr:FAD-dependent oxidoreductase [Planctomycetia bacterium]